MTQVWLYSLFSAFLASVISFVGIFFFPIKQNRLTNSLLYFVSFSVGALLGDVFIHLLPEVVEESGFTLNISLYVLSGIGVSFIMEKILHWRHFHAPHGKKNPQPFAFMNLFGDGTHNFIDGLIIGGSYLVSIPVGVASTIAVILHEIPQEIGDFGILLHAGFSRDRALFFNFITALTAMAGVILSLVISSYSENITSFLVPFAAGNFIYIAGSDFIPELHKEVKFKNNVLQFLSFLLGILVMVALLSLE